MTAVCFRRIPAPLVFLRIIRVVFTWDLEYGWEGLAIGVHSASDSVCDMLIYEHNGNVLPLLRELVEGMFDGGVIRLLIHNEEVFLRIRGVGDVTYSRQKNAGYGIFIPYHGQKLPVLICGLF